MNKCFRCGEQIVVPPKDDSIWNTVISGVCYRPAYVVEVVEADQDCKCVVVCLQCFHSIDLDMWLDRASWEGCNPVVSYDKLPEFNHDAGCEDYQKYPFPKE